MPEEQTSARELPEDQMTEPGSARDRLRRDRERGRGFASDGVASNPNAPRSDVLEEHLREHWSR